MSSIVSVGAVVEAVLPPLEAAVAAVAAVAIDEGAPKHTNGQRFPCPALLSPWFSWGEAGQRPR